MLKEISEIIFYEPASSERKEYGDDEVENQIVKTNKPWDECIREEDELIEAGKDSELECPNCAEIEEGDGEGVTDFVLFRLGETYKVDEHVHEGHDAHQANSSGKGHSVSIGIRVDFENEVEQSFSSIIS